jgi:hypothetical protein
MDRLPDIVKQDAVKARVEAFERSVSDQNGSGAMGPALDSNLATSPLADFAREEKIDERLLAKELYRGITTVKPGADHLKYLNAAREWLGYVTPENKNSSEGQGLAHAIAGALVRAHDEGILAKADKQPKPIIGATVFQDNP